MIFAAAFIAGLMVGFSVGCHAIRVLYRAGKLPKYFTEDRK